MTNSREIVKIALFTLVGLVCAALLWFVLSEARVQREATYSAVFGDVTGLEEGASVRIAGVRVGTVEEVRIHRGDQAIVTFTVVSSRPLTTGTRAAVRYENLVGDRFLGLMEGTGSKQQLEPGGIISNTQTSPALDLSVLLNGFRPLFEGLQPAEINQVSGDLMAVLQGQSGTVNALLGSLASVTNTLADRDQVIGQLVNHLNTVLGTLDERDQQLSATVRELQRLVSGLAADRKPIGKALSEINRLTGTLGELLADARPPLRNTISEIRRTAAILDNNRETVDRVLRTLPVMYQRLGRLGAYGNFFNFYLCSVRIKLTGPNGEPIYTPYFGSNQQTKRCDLPR